MTIDNDFGLNPKYRAYSYVGGGPVYLVPHDWLANGTPNPTTVTTMSVARVDVRALLAAAFARKPIPLPAFAKFNGGSWNQPGINGRSTDLEPGSQPGDPSVTYSAFLRRYVVIADDT